MNPELALRDIHLPQAVGWWPPAPGWWVAAVLLAALAIWAGLAWARRRRRSRVRRAALKALAAVKAEHAAAGDDGRLAAQVSTLLRQACISSYPRPEVAGLTGERWLAFLDTLAASRRGAEPPAPFREGPGRVLAEAPYRNGVTVEAAGLLAAARAAIVALPDAGDARA